MRDLDVQVKVDEQAVDMQTFLENTWISKYKYIQLKFIRNT